MADRVDWAAEFDLIHTTLTALAAKQEGKQLHRIVDPTAATEHMALSDNVWWVGGYLVYFAVGTPWYSSTPILSELLVVRVKAGGVLADVARFLEQQAIASGAPFLAVGTAFASSDRALARLYTKLGFRAEGVTLTKEL